MCDGRKSRRNQFWFELVRGWNEQGFELLGVSYSYLTLLMANQKLKKIAADSKYSKNLHITTY